ncbi:M16 family metallopeptidase [Pseudoxanthomonas putridarboris]|uniref:Insulinase family protein n=1 Tax=Pseudoxanthomonas putridarboris TaxID=752605 RepID=A0ABU9IVP7_9GAMM
MTQHFQRIAFILVLLLLQTGAAALGQTADTAPRFAHEISDIKSDPGVRWGRLENGLRYAVMQNATPKGRASLRFGVMAGSLEETEDQRGLAHFVEHLAFNGSKHFPPGSLVEYFQRLGMSFGGDTNATTAFDRTVYQVELPDTKSETIDTAFTLFGDFADGLLIEQASIEKERGIILSEYRDSDSQASRRSLASSEFAAPNALFVRRLPIGQQEVIRGATRAQLKEYYDSWYRPDNIVIIAVGDFDPRAVERKIVERFSRLEPRSAGRPRPDRGQLTALDQPQAKFYHEPEASAVTVSIGSVAPYERKPDTWAQRIEEMPVNLAIAMVNRRFGIQSRKADAPIVGAQMRVSDSFGFARSVGADAVCRDKEQWRPCVSAVEREVRSAIEQGFSQEELSEVVAGLLNEIGQAARRADARNSGRLAAVALRAIMDEQVFNSPESDLAKWTEVLPKFTPEQCQEALRKIWLANGSPRIFVAGDIKASDTEVLAAFNEGASVPVQRTDKKVGREFAYAVTGQAGEVALRRHVEDLDVTIVEFKNGVRLNLKPTNFESGRILTSIRIGGGLLSAPRDKPGLPLLASSTFTAGGLGKHDVDELNTLLAGKNVSYGFGVASDAFAMGGATTPDDLLLQLQVARAFITDPAFRPEPLSNFRRAVKQGYEQATHSINGPQGMEIPRLMANGDSRFGMPENQDVVLGRTYEELHQWLDPELAHGPIEIAMVGDLDVEKTIAAVAQTFATLPSRATRPAYTEERKVAYPSSPIRKEYRVLTEIERGLVDVRWPTTDQSDIQVARRIRVLAGIFSDRLRLKLREQLGQAYSPNVQDQLSDTFTGYGFIVANASVAPAQAEAVSKAIMEVAEDLVTNGVTPDELNRIKGPLIAHVRDSNRVNAYWLTVIAQTSQEPDRLAWHRSREADFESISVADINALAKRYLPSERASQFISLPEDKR